MTDELNLTRVAILTADDVERSSSNSRARHSRRLIRKLICWRFEVFDIQAFRHAGSALVLCGRYKQRPDRRLLLPDRARSTYGYSARSHRGSRCVLSIRPRGDLLLKTQQVKRRMK